MHEHDDGPELTPTTFDGQPLQELPRPCAPPPVDWTRRAGDAALGAAVIAVGLVLVIFLAMACS